jgi:arylsulfatase A-like enzyme
MLVSRRGFFLGSLALPVLAAKKPVPVRPNILLVLVDGLPSWMLGAYGNKEVHTPNIDRLALAGTRYLNHLVCVPAPEPSRAAILTGRTPMQLGTAGITAADVTVEKVLSGAGYTCQTTGDAAAAAQFLDRQSDSAPFFLNLNHTGLRPPYDGIPQKYLDMYAGQKFPTNSVEPAAPNARAGKEMLADRVANWRKVAAGVTALDDRLGALLTRIYQKQLIDRTLVIFAATCGALLGRRGLWDGGDASDPVNMFDEVVRAPMVWNWPGRVPAQATPVELVSAYDLLPTLCGAVGAETPDRNLCGRSYLPLATGKLFPKKQPWRTTVFAEYRNTDMARDARYKLVLRNEGKGPNELYDLPADPAERVNQAENEQYLGVKNSLGALLAKWKQQFSA